MAHTLVLKKDTSQLIDLLSGDLKLKLDGWSPRTFDFNGQFSGLEFGRSVPAPVQEVISLISTDTAANIRTADNTLADAFRDAWLYHADRMNPDSEAIWLHWTSEGESDKRSLLYKGRFSHEVNSSLNPFLNSQGALAQLGITRIPWWENTAYTQATSGTLNSYGEKWTISNVPGTLPARLDTLLLQRTTGSQYRRWIGIKPHYGQSMTNFDPVMVLGDDGTMGTDTVAQAGGADTVGTNYALCQFATQTGLFERVSMELQDIPSVVSAVEYVGRYLVLLRCKNTAASTTLGLQLRAGIGSTGKELSEKVYIEYSPEYRFVEMGEIKVHLTDLIANFELEIWAERISGNGVLAMDTVLLMPSDHMIKVDGAAGTGSFEIKVNPRLETKSLLTGTGLGAEVSIRDFFIPVGDSTAVEGVEDQAEQDNTATFNTILRYIPRWQNYKD